MIPSDEIADRLFLLESGEQPQAGQTGGGETTGDKILDAGDL